MNYFNTILCFYFRCVSLINILVHLETHSAIVQARILVICLWPRQKRDFWSIFPSRLLSLVRPAVRTRYAMVADVCLSFVSKYIYVRTTIYSLSCHEGAMLSTITPLPPVGHIWDVMLVWRKGNINKNCLCVTVLCTIIMVHKDTSSSYRLVDCIGLWSCLV